jgi:hypothetical protein
MALSPSGVGTPIAYPTQVQGGLGHIVAIAAQPPYINDPIIYEPLTDFTGNQIKIVMIVTGPPDDWGGAQVWASVTAGGNYGQVGTLYQGGTQGLLTATFPSGSNPDTVNTLSVDVTESEGVITAASNIEADLGIAQAYVNGELIGYSTVTLTSAFHYNLGTHIARGLYGTTIGSHAAGTKFGLVDGNVFSQVYPSSWAGRTVYFKFLSFNSVGGGLQSLADVTEYSYTLTGAGFIRPGIFVLDPVTTGVSHTVILSSPLMCTYWTSATAGPKATTIPGAGPTNAGYLWVMKTTLGNFDLHTITPATGTVDGQPTFTFNDNKDSYSLISNGVSNWMIT